MKLLVVGGCGELGWEVVLASLSSTSVTDCVATFNRREPTAEERTAVGAVQWVRLDCGDHAAVKLFVVSTAADAIIHCAVPKHGGAGGKASETVRRGIVDDVVNIAVCKADSTRFIVLGTDLVYDGLIPEGQRYREGDAISPTNFYAESKAEMEAQLSGMKKCIVARTSLILTLGSPSSIRKGHGKGIDFVVNALAGSLPGQKGAFDMFTDEKRNMSFSDDLAVALIALAQSPDPVPSVVHLVADEVASRYDLACRLAHHIKLPDAIGKTVQAALSRESGLNRPLNCALDTARLRALLEPAGLRIQGLSEKLPLRS